MADNEARAVVVFADGRSMKLQSTVDEIQQVTTPHLPLIKVVNQRGDEVWINASHILAFHEYGPRKPDVASA